MPKSTVYDRIAEIIGEEEWDKLCTSINNTAQMFHAGLVGKQYVRLMVMDKFYALRDRFTDEQWATIKKDLELDITVKGLIMDVMDYADKSTEV